VLEALDRGDISPIGLGRVNGRYFCFHAGIGYDAAVVRRVEQRASLKRYAGHPLFVVAALRTWAFDYDRARPHFAVRFPASAGSPEHTVENGFFSIVMNTNPYTYLGNRPFDLVPKLDLDTGLAVVTFTSLGAGHILRSLGSALRGGGIAESPWVDVRTDVSALQIGNDRPFPYQMDGDYLGETRDLRIEHVPDVLRLVRTRPARG